MFLGKVNRKKGYKNQVGFDKYIVAHPDTSKNDIQRNFGLLENVI